MTQDYRILVVDDSDIARQITLAALEEGGFGTITEAGSAEEAYRLLGLEQGEDVPPGYDVILLDIVMADVDGVEACACIRSSRRYRNVPILMVSGQSHVEVLNQAFVAGADDYVGKPIDPIELLARVRSALRLKRERDRRQAREEELRARARQAQIEAGRYLLEADGLPSREAMDAHLQALRDDDLRVAMVLVSIDHIGAYQIEHGDAGVVQLETEIGRALSTLHAPLSAKLGHYGTGLFLLVATTIDAPALEQLATAIQSRVDEAQLPHGSSPESDHVAVSCLMGVAEADDLSTLPARLIAASETAMRAGGNQTLIKGQAL